MPDAPLTNRIELTGDPSSGALRIDGHLLPFSAAVLRLEAPNTPVLSVALPVIGGVVVTPGRRNRVRGDNRRSAGGHGLDAATRARWALAERG